MFEVIDFNWKKKIVHAYNLKPWKRNTFRSPENSRSGEYLNLLAFPLALNFAQVYRDVCSSFHGRELHAITMSRTTGNVKHSCRKFEKTECSSRSICILRSGDSSVFFFTHRSITPARERERERESLGVSSLIYRRRSRGRFSPRCLSTSGNPAVASGSHHLSCKNIYFIPGR